MPNVPTWQECLPDTGDHGYVNTATVEIWMRAVETLPCR